MALRSPPAIQGRGIGVDRVFKMAGPLPARWDIGAVPPRFAPVGPGQEAWSPGPRLARAAEAVTPGPPPTGLAAQGPVGASQAGGSEAGSLRAEAPHLADAPSLAIIARDTAVAAMQRVGWPLRG